MLEIFVLAVLSATVFFFPAFYGSGNCFPAESFQGLEVANLKRYQCQEGEFDYLATLLFSTEGQTIKAFF